MLKNLDNLLQFTLEDNTQDEVITILENVIHTCQQVNTVDFQPVSFHFGLCNHILETTKVPVGFCTFSFVSELGNQYPEAVEDEYPIGGKGDYFDSIANGTMWKGRRLKARQKLAEFIMNCCHTMLNKVLEK